MPGSAVIRRRRVDALTDSESEWLLANCASYVVRIGQGSNAHAPIAAGGLTLAVFLTNVGTSS